MTGVPRDEFSLFEAQRHVDHLFYAERRRATCNFLQILELWVLEPCCESCRWEAYRTPDITPSSWPLDLVDELADGEEILRNVAHLMKAGHDIGFLCGSCGEPLRPWARNSIWVRRYHAEEQFGIPHEDGRRKNPSDWLERLVWEAYGHKCFRCGATKDLTIDHIRPRRPRSKGGGDAAFRNLQPLCRRCNNWKDDREPEVVEVDWCGRFEPSIV
jgi:5-methylcytosine-specific restriction endonuclease McrA